ncbi:Uncharacterised protein [Mycobacteroides abscessus subsp. bolletii]|nr:Uncharacterised protein [Mycobacteroides abscessus subsp. bolletii]SIJ50849.1 Uncharacterised protein [Mycobacteroides abscessus subsp. bolletii]SKS56841.1 Uncharacterised protein [Mycobacteroides abscessus subsp. bolletii]SKT44468.1 Uncharacterised protein [Mycobacteroides abscessus subsp. bolletii]SLD45138.1 Uncharacterised protein [Mycobacteroides abscessus subsp. bolletii]
MPGAGLFDFFSLSARRGENLSLSLLLEFFNLTAYGLKLLLRGVDALEDLRRLA